MTQVSEPEILIRREGAFIAVTLNRPAALNALSLSMIRALSAGLDEWERDETVAAVLIDGAGERAFCAGGDIKAAYRAGMACHEAGGKSARDFHAPAVFFHEEYRLNRRLFHFKKPVVALMNGITMGGGYGIAGPCAFRVACEKTVFAMPETGIGFFPDIAGAHYLNRCPGLAGLYLAVSGAQIAAADTAALGLATHHVPGALWDDMRAVLQAALEGEGGRDPAAAVREILDRFTATPAEAGPVERHMDVIARRFGGADVETIVDGLRSDPSPWAAAAAELIATRSPTSLKVSLARMKEAEGKSFDAVIAEDFVLAQHFLMGRDFYEGVRAMVIDKDRRPQWAPSRLEDVSESDVRVYFRETGYTLDDPLP